MLETIEVISSDNSLINCSVCVCVEILVISYVKAPQSASQTHKVF